MKIDDIPLPPVTFTNDTKLEKIENLNVQRMYNGVNNNFHVKRVVNHKLPLGLLLKDSFCKNYDSVVQKKELYLPTTNDKIHIESISSNPPKKELLSTVSNKNDRDQHKSSKTHNDFKVRIKRRSQEKSDSKEIKRSRLDRRSRDRNHHKYDSKLRSQARVRDRSDSRRNNESRHNITRKNHRDFSRDRRHYSPEKRYSKRKTYYSPRRRRSPSKRPLRHSPHRYNHSKERNGQYRDKNFNILLRDKRKNSPKLDVCNKRKRNSSKKSSFMSSSSSTSSSESSNIELPLVSPKSPEESPKRFSECVKSIKGSSVCSPVQRPVEVAVAANIYLQRLKDTLNKINVAYKTVVANIPEQKNCPEVEVSNIPLPASQVLHDHNANNDLKSPKAVEPIENELLITNGHKHGIRDNYRMDLSNSINADKLSCISDSTIGSKVYRSPLHSFNVSSYSKESENSDVKSRPNIPKIVNFHIDFSSIDRALLSHCSGDFFRDKIQCHCTMPNPDQWNDHGIRACGQGQTCVLSQLKVECNPQRCPTEALCNNCQFQQMKPASVRSSKAELYFDFRHSLSWKLRARSKVQRSTLLFEVSGKAETIDGGRVIEESKSEIFITRDIRVSLKSDPHSLVYYLRQGGAEEANVYIEKWLVNGHIRLGVFAHCDIASRTELVWSYRSNCLGVQCADDPVSLDSTDGVVTTMQSLVHESVSKDRVTDILDQLLSASNPPWVLDGCVRLGVVPLLYLSSQSYYSDRDILTKFMDLLTMLGSCQYNSDTTSLGMDFIAMIDHLVISATEDDQDTVRMKMATVRQSLASIKTETGDVGKSRQSNSNLYTLNCRLPTLWCSRECQCDDEARVFFYHRVTKSVQWDMPVYPWETDDHDHDRDRDQNYSDMYDYNQASNYQVTHDEISQMYLSLNKMYEIKQRRIMLKENNPKPSKEVTDIHKKEVFKKKMTDFIVKLLRPYRDANCREGRITSDEDLRYLANKLSQTILFKELKILNNVVDYLEVTSMVETKTKSYVRTYLQSRGTVYQRPGHPPNPPVHKTLP